MMHKDIKKILPSHVDELGAPELSHLSAECCEMPSPLSVDVVPALPGSCDFLDSPSGICLHGKPVTILQLKQAMNVTYGFDEFCHKFRPTYNGNPIKSAELFNKLVKDLPEPPEETSHGPLAFGANNPLPAGVAKWLPNFLGDIFASMSTDTGIVWKWEEKRLKDGRKINVVSVWGQPSRGLTVDIMLFTLAFSELNALNLVPSCSLCGEGPKVIGMGLRKKRRVAVEIHLMKPPMADSCA